MKLETGIGATGLSIYTSLAFSYMFIQERAEYGAHLLSDFLFPHVVNQIFVIRVHDVRSWC